MDFTTYIFGDIGQLGMYSVNSNLGSSTSQLLYDAGAGASVSWKKFWVLSGIRPLTFRFDMPLYLSHPALDENNQNFRFRWFVGVEQAF
jgi:hypothetical protein